MQSDKLEKILKVKFPQWTDTAVSDVKDITSGWETDIVSFDVDYTLDGSNQRLGLIVRVYPNPHGGSRSQNEYHLMKSLDEIGYPVPKVYTLEPDHNILGRAFVIMERIDGTTMWTQFEENAISVQSLVYKFAQLFVDLHKLDWTKSDYLLERFYSENIRKDFIHYLDYERTALTQQGIGFLVPLVDWMDRNFSKIDLISVSLLHRDFHPGNILIDSTGDVYVIDWTAARTGDPRTDLAWTSLLSILYAGVGIRDEILEQYQRLADIEIEDLDFFMVEACLRRLSDILRSLKHGASSMGMRDETVEVMRSEIDNLTKIHDIVEEIIGIRIKEIDEQVDRYT